MSDSEQLSFKISSALKNLIGKELITDQYVAIFELIKNSFDAYGSNITIEFLNLETKNPMITISDDGNGMNFNDIRDKWLFVAYSAKSDNSEVESDEYRDKIVSKRIFAGAKGVGRFSCDRLGNVLRLVSLKNSENAIAQELIVHWDDFEKDSKKEFIDIKVSHRTIPEKQSFIKHGTILEISGLRDSWNRDMLLTLKHSLEKLINPNQENDSQNFSIDIIAKEQLAEDSKEIDDRQKVNGTVKNSLFEKLGLKTTQLVAEISKDGQYITTTLADRGEYIYTVKEKNPYLISDIKIHLFQLNRSAKINFTRIMGISSAQYGTVFVYKNGFRIYPFGEPGEDILRIDRRKQQGYNRFLGTRDLIGRIEIDGDNNDFKETTSRDGGLIKNKSYYELERFFWDKVLRRLERYVVDLVKWGDPDNNNNEIMPNDIKDEIWGIIKKLIDSEDFVDIQYNQNLLGIVEKAQEKSVSTVIKSLEKHAFNNPELEHTVKQIKSGWTEVIQDNKRLSKENTIKAEELQKINTNLEQTKRQNLFLHSITSLDLVQVEFMSHRSWLLANVINRKATRAFNRFKKGEALTEKELEDFLINVQNISSKIMNTMRFITKANFKSDSEEITENLALFIVDYIEEIYKRYNDTVDISFLFDESKEYRLAFKPIEISIIIDNLLSNAKKAKASRVIINIEDNKNNITIKVKDNGQGLEKTILNINDIFQLGYTTTSGSGIGLYNVAQILQKMNGTIKVNPNQDSGLEFILEVSK